MSWFSGSDASGEAGGHGASLDYGGVEGGPVDDGIGFVQRGQFDPGRSFMEQAVDPHGLLNPGRQA
jgi:hypothetical protein